MYVRLVSKKRAIAYVVGCYALFSLLLPLWADDKAAVGHDVATGIESIDIKDIEGHLIPMPGNSIMYSFHHGTLKKIDLVNKKVTVIKSWRRALKPLYDTKRQVIYVPDKQNSLIAIISTKTDQLVGEIVVDKSRLSSFDHELVADNGFSRLYIADNPIGVIYILDPEKKVVVRTIDVGKEINGKLFLSPDNKYLYVVHHRRESISKINVSDI